MPHSYLEVDGFISKLASLRFHNVFNPYADTCPDNDRSDAAEIRRNNLRLVLSAAIESGVDSLWVARDLGYRGGRRTGLAMTDDVHLPDHGGLFGTLELVRPTKGPAVSERTATVIWQTLRDIGRPVFLWNVFPLHPHEPNDPMSNRRHSRVEREAARQFMSWLIEKLSPRTIVAVGRDAQEALAQFGIPTNDVRHPSYGGQRDFIKSLYRLYGVKQFHQTDLLDSTVLN